MEESGYEIPAAIAYERVGQWSRIALQRGSAWMMTENPQQFQQYPEMLKEGRLTYLPESWDGKFWRTPDAPTATPVSPAWKKYLGSELPVKVLAVRRLRSGVWVQVRLQTESCEDHPGVSPETGWVPAYTPAGKPSVWFYSRGC